MDDGTPAATSQLPTSLLFAGVAISVCGTRSVTGARPPMEESRLKRSSADRHPLRPPSYAQTLLPAESLGQCKSLRRRRPRPASNWGSGQRNPLENLPNPLRGGATTAALLETGRQSARGVREAGFRTLPRRHRHRRGGAPGIDRQGQGYCFLRRYARPLLRQASPPCVASSALRTRASTPLAPCAVRAG